MAPKKKYSSAAAAAEKARPEKKAKAAPASSAGGQRRPAPAPYRQAGTPAAPRLSRGVVAAHTVRSASTVATVNMLQDEAVEGDENFLMPGWDDDEPEAEGLTKSVVCSFNGCCPGQLGNEDWAAYEVKNKEKTATEDFI